MALIILCVFRGTSTEITSWYMTKNKAYGGLSPREYLRGKDWAERTSVGVDALIDHGVLKP
jgi:hypothetical protein